MRPPAESPRAPYLFTGLGLLLGFGFVVIPLHTIFYPIFDALGLPWLTIYELEDVSLKVFVVLAILALVLYGERRPLRSIGIQRPRLSDVALGIGAFAIGEAAMYLMAALLPHRFASGAEGRLALFAQLPLWLMLLGSLVNGMFEEISARGFAVERLSQVTHSTIAGALIALALNLMTHIPYWGWRQTIILAPALATFLALYLWRRRVVPCAIGHILNDAFPRLLTILPALVPIYLAPYLSYDRQGSIYYTKGDFDRSIQLFTRAIARDPHDAYAFDWRGLARLNKKDYANSFSDFDEAIRLYPESAMAYGDRAFAHFIKHDDQPAIVDLSHAIALEPDQANWYEMRARIEFELLDFVRARNDLDRAVQLDPTNADLYGQRAHADFLSGDSDRGLHDCQIIVRFRPDDADAWNDLAVAYASKKDYANAFAALQHTLKIDPRSTFAYQYRARIHDDLGEYDLALADFDKAIASNSDDPYLYECRAKVRVKRNDLAGALGDLASALKLDPKRSDLYVERAWIYAVQKNHAAAIAEYASAIALKQDDSSLYVQRGEMYYRTHEYAAAMADWKKALELKHDDGATYNSMAWLLATSTAPKARDGKKAIEFATRACELSAWKDGEVVDTLAAAYAEADNFKRAVEFENKAIALMKPSGDTVKEARARLELYEHRRPYRETPD